MSTEKRPKRPQFVSPKGRFRYPKLNDPDYGNDKHRKPNGEYNVQLILKAGSPEAQKLIKDLTPLHQEALATASEQFKELSLKARKAFEKDGKTGPSLNALFETLYDKETEEETGEIGFKFATKASGVYQSGPKKGKPWKRKPEIFDAKGKRMFPAPAIWGGTEGKVSFEAGGYFVEGTAAAGLKLYLKGVQVLKLVSEGGASAESMGFGEEDGYEYSAPDDAPEGDFADATGEASSDGGDDMGDF